MPKRKNRTVCLDRLDSAIGNLAKANSQLGTVRQVYFDNGAYQGAQLEMISKAIDMAKETLEHFRYNVA